jgi:hypothetical protein
VQDGLAIEARPGTTAAVVTGGRAAPGLPAAVAGRDGCPLRYSLRATPAHKAAGLAASISEAGRHFEA